MTKRITISYESHKMLKQLADAAGLNLKDFLDVLLPTLYHQIMAQLTIQVLEENDE